jgi:microcystin-dependent protein
LDVFLGQIAILPYQFTPASWAPCQGQILQISSTTAALFSLVGNQFGGDGRQTFALPNLPDPAPGMRYFIATVGNLPQRS